MKKNYILLLLITLLLPLLLSGCIVGDTVALPFRVTGAVLNTITPDIVGDTVSGAGEVLDAAIPF